MAKPRVRLASSEKRQWIFLLGVLGVVSLLFVVLMVIREGASFSWKSIAFWDTGENPAEVTKLAEESLSFENEFKGRVIVGVPTADDLKPLQEAIRAQREFIQKTKVQDERNIQRLEKLETTYAEAEAQSLVKESAEAEAAAKESEAAGDFEGARRELERAYKAQVRINSSRAKGLRNSGRESTLARSLQNLAARPYAEESKKAEAEARELVKSEKWTEALKTLTRAHELQLKINREFNNSTFANSARLEKLDIEISSFATGGLIQDIQRLLDRGQEAMMAGRHSEAALAYRGALEKQLRINADFPKSRFASRDKVEEYRVAVETSESFGVADRLRSADNLIAESLRSQRIEVARQAVDKAVLTLKEFQTSYRRSTLIDEETKFRVAYFAQVQGEFAQIQGSILPKLLEVPGKPGVSMLASEVPQLLYRRVMLSNPSRNQGDDLPVESVSFEEAQDFCRRLGWCMGRSIRLPTVEEFRAAAGSYNVDTLPDGFAWIGENSSQKTQPIATTKPLLTGYYDILGNVAEWLSTPDVATANATVAGGSYADRVGAFRELPLGSRQKLDRSRTLGFRFVLLPLAEKSVEAAKPPVPAKPASPKS